MADGLIENIFLVNAPAGSGKTTRIKEMIIDHTARHPHDNILCITYTNRAADELKNGLDTDKAHISTVHSFLQKFVGLYFSHKQVLDLYFQSYGNAIQERIANAVGDPKRTASNERYIQKYGTLTYEAIKENIKAIYYNESQYSSLLYGGLSHDDLVTFSEEVFRSFPVISKRLSQKYQMIFIDEYQDSSSSVLRMFYEAVRGTHSKLYFLGDKMQQIYKNYDGTFESTLPTLNRSISLSTNHRSIPSVVNILNNLYNESAYKQRPSQMNASVVPDHQPRVLICTDINTQLEAEKKVYPNALLLFLPNQKKFDAIGAGTLYKQVKSMEKYSFISQNEAVDVLTDDTTDNPDPLFKLLFLISKITNFYSCNNLGSMIQLFKANQKIFDKLAYMVSSHADKIRLKGLLETLIKSYSDANQPKNIDAVLDTLMQTGLANSDFISAIKSDPQYSSVLQVSVCEFRAMVSFLESKNVSTQHGVKGESHDTVFFIAEDSFNTPVVHMYRFFELWSTMDFSLWELERFYYEYMGMINNAVQNIGFKPSSINKELHATNTNCIVNECQALIRHFQGHEIFNCLCSQPYHDYLAKLNVTTAKACFKESTPYGTLSAYRLFYVGCSRSRRNLTIIVDRAKIAGFEDLFIEKLKRTGFTVCMP